jgi:hypothetical protein
LQQAGAVSPHVLRDEILKHPNISIKKAKVSRLRPKATQTEIWQDQDLISVADHVIVCCAKQSAALFENYPVLKPIRGQVSWVNNTIQPLALDQAYSYGGYCMQLDDSQLILGASFYLTVTIVMFLLKTMCITTNLSTVSSHNMLNNFHRSTCGMVVLLFGRRVQTIFL